MSNIPLGILQKVNAVERLGVTGEYKKESVVNDILSLIDDNVDIQQIIEDLIELLIDISKKKLKLIVNKKSCIPI
jgi:tRNA U34 5-carboxymethylaminomethyl modifying GTPase MnmE/TrmE